MILMSSPQKSVLNPSCRRSISLSYHPQFKAIERLQLLIFVLSFDAGRLVTGLLIPSYSPEAAGARSAPCCSTRRKLAGRQPLRQALWRLPPAQRRLHSSHRIHVYLSCIQQRTRQV